MSIRSDARNPRFGSQVTSIELLNFSDMLEIRRVTILGIHIHLEDQRCPAKCKFGNTAGAIWPVQGS